MRKSPLQRVELGPPTGQIGSDQVVKGLIFRWRILNAASQPEHALRDISLVETDQATIQSHPCCWRAGSREWRAVRRNWRVAVTVWRNRQRGIDNGFRVVVR